MNSHYPLGACKQQLKVVANDQRSALSCLEDADETGSLKTVGGGALGSEPEAITGIPLKVNTEQRVEEPLSLSLLCIYVGMKVWGLFTPCAISV